MRKQINSVVFQNIINKLLLYNDIFNIYMNKQDLALNSL